MTAYDNSSHLRTVNSPAPPFWVCLVLGIVMVLAGVMVLSDIMFLTVISALFIGLMSVAAGAFEIFHAFWIKWWGGFVWQVLLGILYIAFGFVLASQPLVGSLIITYLLGLLLAVSGFVRIVLGAFYWKELGWSMPFLRSVRDSSRVCYFDRIPGDGSLGSGISIRRRPDIPWFGVAHLRSQAIESDQGHRSTRRFLMSP
jgi:uncharacterized membrane protein HdeD (DUF308 family)